MTEILLLVLGVMKSQQNLFSHHFLTMQLNPMQQPETNDRQSAHDKLIKIFLEKIISLS